MPVAVRQATKREALNIRIQPQIRELIDRAAQLSGKNRTDFVLDAARRAAEDALLDRAVLTVGPKAYRQFLARLDAPPRPNKRLLKRLQTPAPWERACLFRRPSRWPIIMNSTASRRAKLRWTTGFGAARVRTMLVELVAHPGPTSCVKASASPATTPWPPAQYSPVGRTPRSAGDPPVAHLRSSSLPA